MRQQQVFDVFFKGTRALQTLVQHCLKQLKKEFLVDEPVEVCVSGKW